MMVGTKGCPRFYYASLVLKQLIFIYFSEKWVVLDQTYSFENRELLIIAKNADTLLYSSLSWNSVQNFKTSRQTVLVLMLGVLIQPMIFIYFSFSSPLKFSWHSPFNLAGSTRSFYWCYIFFFWIFVILKYQYSRKNTCHSIAISEHNKKKVLENDKNVQKQPLEVFYKKSRS